MSDTCEPAFIPCTAAELPAEDMELAAKDATKENPANAPPEAAVAMLATALVNAGADDLLTPQRIAFLTGMYWGTGGVDLTVGFLEPCSVELREKFLKYMNATGQEAGKQFANIKFRWTQTDPMVRITREGDGYWSYIGVGIKRIPKGQPTMCLQAFTLSTPEAEWRRVVPHETLHTCGCPHEHLRKEIVADIDPEKAYTYFAKMGWNRATTQSNVLTPLDERSIMGTPHAEEDSIMAYWLPAEIMKNGDPITGGKYLTEGDRAFIAKVYPIPGGPVEPPIPPTPVGNKIYIEITGTVTSGKQVALPTDNSKAHVIVSTANDPGAVNVTTTIPSTPPANGGGSGMFAKLIALWAAIRAGDWLKVFELLSEFGNAQKAGQLTGEECDQVEAALQQAQAQFGQPKAAKK